MIETTCPSCAQKLKVADEAAGKKARCSKCGRVFTVEETHDDVQATKPAALPPHRPPSRAIAAGPPALRGEYDRVPADTRAGAFKRLRKGHRQRLNTSTIIVIVLATTGLLGSALLVASIWTVMPHAKASAVAAETPEATAPAAAQALKATAKDAAESPDTLTPVRHDAGDEKVTLLRDAEERLSQLREEYAQTRKVAILVSLKDLAPAEFKGCVKDVGDAGPLQILLEKLHKKVEDEDRRLAANDRAGNDNGRAERKGTFLLQVEMLGLGAKNPDSVVGRIIEKQMESLDITKQLREQERLIEPLRQEVQALKASGKARVRQPRAGL